MSQNIPFIDLHPKASKFTIDVHEGLKNLPKKIPAKYFYDKRGSELFDEICTLPEYYQTRTETKILRDLVPSLKDIIPGDITLIEYGSGSSVKTQILLDHWDNIKTYIPLDISKEHLLETAAELKSRYPQKRVLPICADYNDGTKIKEALAGETSKRVIFFPGSTIGNLVPDRRKALLKSTQEILGQGGYFLVGIDLASKDTQIINRAYNDDQGVTAEFNLNLLSRINRELDANFNVRKFSHKAFFNKAEQRIEMHLISQAEQSVRVGEERINFEVGESIHTENSYKFTVPDFTAEVEKLSYSVEHVWQDPKKYFAIFLLKN